MTKEQVIIDLENLCESFARDYDKRWGDEGKDVLEEVILSLQEIIDEAKV